MVGSTVCSPGCPLGGAGPESAINSVALPSVQREFQDAHVAMTWPTPAFRVSTSSCVGLDLDGLGHLSDFQDGIDRQILPTSRTMPVCTYVRKPGKAASTRYGPKGRLVGRTNPSRL